MPGAFRSHVWLLNLWHVTETRGLKHREAVRTGIKPLILRCPPVLDSLRGARPAVQIRALRPKINLRRARELDDNEYRTARQVLSAALADQTDAEAVTKAAAAIVVAQDLRRLVTAMNEQTLRLEAIISELQGTRR